MAKHSKIGGGIVQIYPGSKNGNINFKENTKGHNPGDRKSRNEIRSHGCKHQQQNTRNRREKSQV